MAQLTKVQFVAKYNDIFADNITRQISEADFRELIVDINDSFFNAADYVAPSASFSSITGNATDNASIVALANDILNTIRGGIAPDYDNLKKLYDFVLEQLETKQDSDPDGGTPEDPLTTIKLKGGPYASWAAENPILADREPGWVSDSKVIVVGDGVKDFNTLWAEHEAGTTASGKYFASESDLIAAYPPDAPERKAGDWALVQGATAVTIWTWNPSTELWEDTEEEVVITVDTVLSETSGNPIANSTVTIALNSKLDKTGTIEITQVNGLPAALGDKLEESDIYGILSVILQQGFGMQLVKNGTTITFVNVAPGGGTMDYNILINKPKINGVELVGDVDSATLGISYNDLVDLPPPVTGSTNLGQTLSASNVIITSDTGTDATIPPVDNTNAGVVTPTQKAGWDNKAPERWLGTFPSLTGLQTTHPTASAGDTASIDEGASSKVQRYEWDASDSQWVPVGSGAGMVEKNWKFATNTAESDPGNGNFRMDNANPTLVTKLFFSETAQSSFDAAGLFRLLKLGMTIVIQQSNNAGKTANFQISGTPVDNGTWWTVPVIVVTPTPSLFDGSASCSVFFNFATSLVQNASETVAGIVEEATDAQTQDPANTGTGETGARLFVSIPKLWNWFKSLFTWNTLTFAATVNYDLTGKKWGDSKKLPGITGNYTLNITAGQAEETCVFHIYARKTTASAVIISLGGAGITHKDGDTTITALTHRAEETVCHMIGKVRWTGTAVEIDWNAGDGSITQTLSASTTDYPSVGLVNSELLLRHKQGGNAYGVAATIGTTDAFDTSLIRGGVAKATATAAGVLVKGAGTGTGQSFEAQNSSGTRGFFVSDAGLIKVGAGAPASNLDVSGSVSFGYRAITAARTLDVTDHIIDCTANTFDVTLPTAVGVTGRRYVIKNTGAGVITIKTTASQTIDGATTKTLAAQYDKIIVVSNGANWIVTG